jgi:hypothetical protein
LKIVIKNQIYKKFSADGCFCLHLRDSYRLTADCRLQTADRQRQRQRHTDKAEADETEKEAEAEADRQREAEAQSEPEIFLPPLEQRSPPARR